MAARNPQATISARKFQDPETTPKSPRRPLPGLHIYATPRTPTRTNSFEEMEVTSLPDPRTPEHSHIDFQHVWNETYMQVSLDAVERFVPELEAMLTRTNRYPDFVRFWHMLSENTTQGTYVSHLYALPRRGRLTRPGVTACLWIRSWTKGASCSDATPSSCSCSTVSCRLGIGWRRTKTTPPFSHQREDGPSTLGGKRSLTQSSRRLHGRRDGWRGRRQDYRTPGSFRLAI